MLIIILCLVIPLYCPPTFPPPCLLRLSYAEALKFPTTSVFQLLTCFTHIRIIVLLVHSISALRPPHKVT